MSLITKLTRTSFRAIPRIAVATPLAARPVLRASTHFSHLSSSSRLLSSSAPRCEPSSLSSKLGEELKYEQETNDEGEPEWLKEFKAEGVWTVKDVAGADEVTLERTYGEESIRLIFSISDLDAEPADEEYDEADEKEDAANTETLSSLPEDEHDDAHEGPSDESFPVETSITITKPGQGALSIDAVAEDGLFTINNISFYNDSKVALGLTSEDDWNRQGLYLGPDFENLEEGVQAEFESFLEERGLNSNLALFIPDLAEYKEQREYIAWLKGVKGFLEA